MTSEQDSKASEDETVQPPEPAPDPVVIAPSESSPPPDPLPAHDLVTRAGTFQLMSRMTIVVGVVCFLLLATPYVGLISWLVDAEALAVGCRIAVATQLFNTFCVHSVRFFGTAFGGLMSLSGALFLLNNLHAPLKFEGEQRGTSRVALETASPGLVMILAGVVLVVAGMYRDIQITGPGWICLDKISASSSASSGGSSTSQPTLSLPDASLKPGCSASLGECEPTAPDRGPSATPIDGGS